MTDTSWTIHLDRTLYERAVERARLENQDLEQLVERYLAKWLVSPSSAFEVYSVRAGDSLWSVATRLAPGEDPRPIVDALAEARHGAPLAPGERVEWGG